MSEYDTCYVFTAENAHGNDLATLKSKKRKLSKSVDFSRHFDEPPFVPLLTGLENEESVTARYDLFKAAWSPQQQLINSLLQDANNDTVTEVTKFIADTEREFQTTGKISAGLIVAQPGTEIYPSLVASIAEQLKGEERVVVVNLTASQTPNLKAVLKHINQHATNQVFNMTDEETVLDRQKGSRRLNYDLQILDDYVKLHSISRVVLSFQDSETFEGGLLGDIVDVLSSWSDRIPFVLLFGITTSIDLFQEKLSRATVRSLRGRKFDLEQLSVEELFKIVASLTESRFLWLGSGLSSNMIHRHNDYVQSISSFVEATKYAYMTHFFANPLTIFLDAQLPLTSVQSEHYDGIRNLPSFQRLAETLVEQGDYKTTQSLLRDNNFLHNFIMCEIEKGQSILGGLLLAIETISVLQSCSPFTTGIPWSEMYIQAMSGKLAASTLIKDTLLSFRKMSSDSVSDLLSKLSPLELPGISDLEEDLKELTSTPDDEAPPLRSEHDVHHDSLRTTIVAQKVSLSKNSSALSKQDLAYSKIISSIDSVLRDFFQTALIDPRELFLHEILIYNSTSPHRDVFTPRARFAVERALSAPHDYLDCSCCDGAGEGLSATQPAAAILYQLYLESGAVINTSDLWSAFYAIVGIEDAEDEDADQRRALALFSRALAELKYLGMIKQSRKKADHLVKLSWKGL